MTRAGRAIAGLVTLGLIVAGIAAATWFFTRGTLSGAVLTGSASPGIASPHESPPIVPIYTVDGAVEIDARLCPASNKALPAQIPSALWAASGSTWHIVDAAPKWTGNAECRSYTYHGVAREVWPGVDHGVVRWAIVVGAASATSPEPVHAANSWRHLGLLVFDGEAIRQGDARVEVH